VAGARGARAAGARGVAGAGRACGAGVRGLRLGAAERQQGDGRQKRSDIRAHWGLLKSRQAKPPGEGTTTVGRRGFQDSSSVLGGARRGLRFGGGEGLMKNPLSHFEIYADNPDALARFYTSLFDWKVEQMPGNDNYTLVQTVDVDDKRTAKQAGGINGGIMKR